MVTSRLFFFVCHIILHIPGNVGDDIATSVLLDLVEPISEVEIAEEAKVATTNISKNASRNTKQKKTTLKKKRSAKENEEADDEEAFDEEEEAETEQDEALPPRYQRRRRRLAGANGHGIRRMPRCPRIGCRVRPGCTAKVDRRVGRNGCPINPCGIQVCKLRRRVAGANGHGIRRMKRVHSPVRAMHLRRR